MVNADRVAWLLYGTRKEKLHWDVSAVGNHISTKRVGSNEREDITGAYKHREGMEPVGGIYRGKVSSNGSSSQPDLVVGAVVPLQRYILYPFTQRWE